MDQQSSEAAPQKNQRAPRHQTVLSASVRRPEEPPIETVLSDLSLDGCKIIGYFGVGESLIVNIPKIGQFDAGVNWARGGTAGLRFVRQSSTDRDIRR